MFCVITYSETMSYFSGKNNRRACLNRFRPHYYVIPSFLSTSHIYQSKMADAFTYYRSVFFLFFFFLTVLPGAHATTGDGRWAAFSGRNGSGSPRPSGGVSTTSCSLSPVLLPTPPTCSGSPLVYMPRPAPMLTASSKKL